MYRMLFRAWELKSLIGGAKPCTGLPTMIMLRFFRSLSVWLLLLMMNWFIKFSMLLPMKFVRAIRRPNAEARKTDVFSASRCGHPTLIFSETHAGEEGRRHMVKIPT